MITTINEQYNKYKGENVDKIKSQYEEEALTYKIAGADFFELVEDEENKTTELMYKNQVAAKSMNEITEILPELKNAKFLYETKRPYFVDNLQNIRRAIDEGEKIAVEGGPCLFGVDEVLVRVVLNDGESAKFDYSTGRNGVESTATTIVSSELEMYNYIEEHSGSIKAIEFTDQKKGVTTAEYESIKILFDVANALNCPFVMPIVDMSYQKYLEFATRSVDKSIRNKAIDEFANIVHRIADLYINVANNISKEYPNVKYEIMHDRTTELVDLYYENRIPFIERKKVLHCLTDVPIRLEPIKDYCTMPALPYYFYGIKNILQVDCLDETDSHRKCKRAHRNTLIISALLYPEEVDPKNNLTMFNAPLEEKKYL